MKNGDTLGAFIQKRLNELEWKQADLVKCSGFSVGYVSALTTDTAPSSKRGSYLPDPEKLDVLARCLQCSHAELLEAMGYLPASEVGDPQEGRLIEMYRRLPNGVREIFSVIGASLDRNYGAGNKRATHPGVLASDDKRPDTARPISAAALPPQTGKKGTSKRRGGNGG